MSALIKVPGWQVVPVRATMLRQYRRGWRAPWPVMIGGLYYVGLTRHRRFNGGYVRLGPRMFGICIMPWRKSIYTTRG